MSAVDRGHALVTGASQGLGAALALELAGHGFGVVLTARNGEKLRQVAEQAAGRNGGRAHVIECDLARPGAAVQLAERVLGLGQPLSCLVNNAGYGLWGLFQELDLEEQLQMMRLNMEVPVALTHALLPALKQAGRGYILNVSSMTAYTAMPAFAVYAASKAFVLRWSRGLRGELAGSAVGVTAVCPGSILTGFTARAGMQAMDDLARKFGTGPGPVARTAVKAMLKGKSEIVPGLLNRVTVMLQRQVPDSLNEQVVGDLYMKRLAAKDATPNG